MNWLKILGWFLFIAPILTFVTFSVWMILSVMKDDSNIASFVSLVVVLWLIGLGILVLTYFFDASFLSNLFV